MSSSNGHTGKFYPASEAFDVEAFPPYWIARLNAQYGLCMEKTLKTVKMDVSRWRVAMILRVYGDLSISRIAEHAVGKLPTITKIVYRMQDEGLVTVSTSARDGRVSLVGLSGKGYAVVDQVLAATQGLFERLFSGFTEAQIGRLNGDLQKMLDNLRDGSGTRKRSSVE